MAGNEWTGGEWAREYLARADSLPHRGEGEAALLDLVSPDVRCVIDLGTGDGRLLAMVLRRCPSAEGVALDFSATMLRAVRERFAGDDRVSVVAHDLDDPLPDLGQFDMVVSSFAIHHCSDQRKRSLYEEIMGMLVPGGTFANLEHVASPTPAVHQRYLRAVGVPADHEDPSNHLLDVETQLQWLREIGFTDVDCYWKWLEFAVIAGVRPNA